MNIDASLISSAPPLLLRIIRELADRATELFDNVRCFVVTGRFTSRSQSSRPDGLFSSLRFAAEEPLLVRLFEAARVRASQMAMGSRQANRPELATEVGTGPGADDELAFLWEAGTTPFPVRLAREIRGAVAALASDPVALIKPKTRGFTVTTENQRRLGPGIAVAIMVYAVAFSATYAASSLSRRHRPSGNQPPELRVINLAPLPPPALRPTPPVRSASGAGAKHSNVTVRPIEPEPVVAKPDPHPIDQVPPAPKPQPEVAKELAAPEFTGAARAKTSVGTSGNGTGGTGTGRGTGSGNGSDLSSTSSIDYGSVFSVSSVTVRPKMLSHPTPGYTDEARRAQIAGVVKLTVVLNTDGTVSDIRVVRGLGFGLDEKAVEAARELRFVPAQKDGRTVSVQVFLEFKFTLL